MSVVNREPVTSAVPGSVLCIAPPVVTNVPPSGRIRCTRSGGWNVTIHRPAIAYSFSNGDETRAVNSNVPVSRSGICVTGIGLDEVVTTARVCRDGSRRLSTTDGPSTIVAVTSVVRAATARIRDIRTLRRVRATTASKERATSTRTESARFSSSRRIRSSADVLFRLLRKKLAYPSARAVQMLLHGAD
jgi:hypothetical protein